VDEVEVRERLADECRRVTEDGVRTRHRGEDLAIGGRTKSARALIRLANL